MHLLASQQPRDRLAPTAVKALDEYQTAVDNQIPAPEVAPVAAWNASVDDTDFRRTVLRRPAPENTPTLDVRFYPRSFAEYESLIYKPAKPRIYKEGMAIEVYEWLAKLKQFVAVAYPDKH
jgi:hypothetical protein